MKLSIMKILSPVQNLQSRNWNKKKKVNNNDNKQNKLTIYYCKVKSSSKEMLKNPVRNYSYTQQTYNNQWSSVNFLNNKPRQFSTYSNFNSHKKNRNDFTINLTHNEPRLVIYNQQRTFYAKSKPQQIRHNKNKNQIKNHRYRLININVNKLKAPYNTTQYLMYDYSKRRGPLKDQQCPDEQEQFTNDWNLALNQHHEQDPSLVLLKNFFSLSKNNDTESKLVDESSVHNDNYNEQDSQMRFLKKSLSELDLTSENELSNFLSTSI